MKPFTVTIIPPAGADRKLDSTYRKLADDIAGLAAQRKTDAERWHSLAQQGRGGGDDMRPDIQVQLNEIEIAALERELPTLKRTPAYLQSAAELRRREVAIAREMIPLAEAHVVATFQNDFDPNRWPVRPAALAYYVANHPIVLGAHDRLAEVDASPLSNEKHLLHDANTTIARAEDRLNDLRRNHAQALQRVTTQQQAHEAKAAEQAANREKESRHCESMRAAQQNAAEEARKRVGV